MTKKELEKYLRELNQFRYSKERNNNKYMSLLKELRARAKADGDEVALTYANCYIDYQTISNGKGDESTVKKLFNAVQKADEIGDPGLISECRSRFGIVLTKKGDNVGAYENFKAAFDASKKGKLYLYFMKSSNNMAGQLVRLGALEPALLCLREGYQISLDKRDTVIEQYGENAYYFCTNTILKNIADIYYKLGDYENALRMISCIEGLFGDIDKMPVPDGYKPFCACVFLRLGRYAEAEKYNDMDVFDAYSTAQLTESVNNYFELARILLENNYPHNVKKILGLLEKVVFKLGPREACEYLAIRIDYERAYINDKDTLLTLYSKYYEANLMLKKQNERMQTEFINNRLLLEKEIERRNKAEKKSVVFKARSEHDPLTGAYNRYVLNSTCQKWCDEAAKDENKKISVTILDVDNFKYFNDKFGHMFGDKVLMTVYSVIKKNCTNDDAVIRYGGDEFFIVSRNLTDDKVLQRSKKISRDLSEQIIADGKYREKVTITQGIVNGRMSSGKTLLDFIHLADEALYKIKNSGKDGICFIDPESEAFSVRF